MEPFYFSYIVPSCLPVSYNVAVLLSAGPGFWTFFSFVGFSAAAVRKA